MIRNVWVMIYWVFAYDRGAVDDDIHILVFDYDFIISTFGLPVI